MKTIIILSLLISNISFAGSISGTVELKGKQPKGTLFIFAKKFDGSIPMPLAVKRIANPVFPIKFQLNDKDKMIKEMNFKGPFRVTARISPSGSAMDKSGAQTSTKNKVQLGDKNIKLIIEN